MFRRLPLSILILVPALSAQARVSLPYEDVSADLPPSHSAASSETESSESPCEKAYLSNLAVFAMDTLPSHDDYCTVSEGELPDEVKHLLEKISDVHLRMASAVGKEPAELFGSGVNLLLAGNTLAWTASVADEAVELTVLPDFQAAHFPEVIYAHEATHWLLGRGKLGERARAIEPTLSFIESFPDLVASYALRTTQVRYPHPALRESLTLIRDAGGVRTLREPFANFRYTRVHEAIYGACRALRDPREKNAPTAAELSFCDAFESAVPGGRFMERVYAPTLTPIPTAVELAAPFSAEKCILQKTQTVRAFKACDLQSIGSVLLSFFKTIEKDLGDKPIATLLRALDESTSVEGTYSCRFKAQEIDEGQAVSRSTLRFSGVLRDLRNSMDPEAQARFDSAWDLHGLQEWVRIEEIDQEIELQPAIYRELIEKNPEFARKNQCASAGGSHALPILEECQMACESN